MSAFHKRLYFCAVDEKTALMFPSIYDGPNALELFIKGSDLGSGKVLILTDSNTAQDCLPLLRPFLPQALHFSIPAGEASKNLDNCALIWQVLSENHFSRQDFILNLGGGMICDLGGFAASCYKRGIPFVNVPTSLLAMADAAIGGKTGIDFMGYKNQVGSFAQAEAVVLHAAFLQTLPAEELRSGYAEVLKHALIFDAERWQKLAALPALPDDWTEIVKEAVATKLHFAQADPKEKGIRKALNLGHTVGHALESHFLQHESKAPMLHGDAVAAGIWIESLFALQRGLISQNEAGFVCETIQKLYPKANFDRTEVPMIAAWCLQDKKNEGGKVNCSLLKGIGGFALDQKIELAEVEAGLIHYLEAYP